MTMTVDVSKPARTMTPGEMPSSPVPGLVATTSIVPASIVEKSKLPDSSVVVWATARIELVRES
jgi:hypothetical protein